MAAIRLPRLSNFTDLDPLVVEPGVRVRWVDQPGALGDPDLVVLGGSRATAADLQWLRDSGLAGALAALRAAPVPPVLLGICGGFQMLGTSIDDPAGVESATPATAGLGWLPVHTVFGTEKVTRLTTATGPGGTPLHGYEIRHGHVAGQPGCRAWLEGTPAASASDTTGTVVGTTLHGLFEGDAFRAGFLAEIAARRGRAWRSSGVSYAAARVRQVDRIADACESYLDTEQLWRLVERGIRHTARPA